MPSRATIERFLARVESGATVEAIEEFYAPEASMRENHLQPRVGRDVLVQHERQAGASVTSAKTVAMRPVFIEGDLAVVRWTIEFVRHDGTRTRFQELAYQRWSAERIVEEQFFYDPAQLKEPASGDDK